MAYRKENLRLRFFDLSADELGKVRASLPGAEVRPPKSAAGGNILVFELREDLDLGALQAVLDSMSLRSEQFQVVASVVTTSDNGGVDLPSYVLDFASSTRCGIGFSFVSVGPDEGDE